MYVALIAVVLLNTKCLYRLIRLYAFILFGIFVMNVILILHTPLVCNILYKNGMDLKNICAQQWHKTEEEERQKEKSE